VGTPDKIKKVAKRIAALKNQNQDVVVVVSAMGDTTDELLDLAQQVSPRGVLGSVHDRELDMLLTAGERISMALLSMALKDLGVQAISFTGSQAGILTDQGHTRAKILEIRGQRILDALAQKKVVIVAGFQGVSATTKEITTLGRGGSDTTAVALACVLAQQLKAQATEVRCEVLTDVPGIFSADPRLVEKPYRYERLPLELVFEMAALGAQVMHPRSIEIARRFKMPLYVGLAHPQTPNPSDQFLFSEGTMLMTQFTDAIDDLELSQMIAITAKKNLNRFCIPITQSQLQQEMLSFLAQKSMQAHQMRFQENAGFEFFIDAAESQEFTERYKAHQDSRIFHCLSFVGYQLQNNVEKVAEILSKHDQLSIKVLGLTTHPHSISVWFETGEIQGELNVDFAARRLHELLIQNARCVKLKSEQEN
jgi:aspartate kinase